MINVISQSLGIDLVNINVHAQVYQNIPNGLRVIDIFLLFVQSVWGQNLRKLSGDKIKWLIIGDTLKISLQLRLTFMGRAMSIKGVNSYSIMLVTSTSISKKSVYYIN